MIKKTLFTTLFVLFCSAVLLLGLRGNPGNPTSEELNTPQWKEDGPLELSPDRGRFGLMYSVAEDKSVFFSVPVARFTTPDLAINKEGRYVSLFAPGLSYAIIPGYIIGKYFGYGQVGAFSIVLIFAVINALLIRLIATKLGSDSIAATIAACVFLFATPAFTYGVTLYQHHLSVFLILCSLWLLLSFDTAWALAIVWFLCGLSVVIDNPNLFMMFPLGLWGLTRIVYIDRGDDRARIVIRPWRILTMITIVIPLIFFGWYNMAANGSPTQLSGTLKSVEAVGTDGLPTQSDIVKLLEIQQTQAGQKEKSAVGFFKTRHLLNGFYTHFVSPDRGVLWFTPIMFLSIFGFVFLFKKNEQGAKILLAIAGANILLYSMWGDPYGGWAFGSRYLVPTYALASIALAFALSHWRKSLIFISLFFVVCGYSVWVNALGAITSSRNPPQVQVLSLEKISGVQEKYTFERDHDLLKRGIIKSIVYKEFASRFFSPTEYHTFIVSIILIVIGCLQGLLFIRSRRSHVS